MPAPSPSPLLLTPLVSAICVLFPLSWVVLAQSTEKSPPVPTSTQSNQQSTQADALVETPQQEVRERNERRALVETLLLNQQVIELYKQARYDAAIPLAEQALAIREKAFGPEHPYVAVTLQILASLYDKKRNYARAEPLYQRALAVYEKALGPNHLDVATALNDLASLYQHKGDYGRAEPLFRRVLAIREKTLGPEHPEVARVLTNLAILYQSKLDYVRAEPLYQRALAIEEKVLSPNHPDTATTLNNLALLYQDKGDYARAEPLFQRALAIEEKAFGPSHPDVAPTLKNLAAFYQSKSDYARAEPMIQRALAIEEKVLGPNHPHVATTLNNLAVLYEEKGDHARAERLYQRALAINEKALGPEHPAVAIMLTNLAGLYNARGEYARAEPLLQRALAISEKVLGSEHPLVGTTLNSLALLYEEKGDYARAESLFKRALAIREKAFGSNDPVLVHALFNLATLYEAKNYWHQAIRLMVRASELREKHLAPTLTAGSENQKRIYLARLSREVDATISLHLQSAPNNTKALRLALTTILRRKGRTLDTLTDQFAALRRRSDPQDRALLDPLSATRAQLATLVFKGASQTNATEHRAEVARLEGEAERLEAQVSTRSAEFRAATQPITIERVQQAIPAGVALIELVSYKPLNAKRITKAEKWGPPRYVAYVLRRQGPPSFVDLGEAAPINQGIRQLRAALADPESTDAKEAARALDQTVMRPLRKLIGGVKQLLLSPDGNLNLVPFSALADENNRYLVESYSISYLTSGRDLLRLEARAPPRQGAVVIANPLFDLSATENQSSTATRKGQETAVQSSAQTPNASPTPDTSRARRSVDLTTGTFSPLTGTAKEAQAIAALLPGVKLLTEASATESALKQVIGPRILHIATHGFFLPDQPEELSDQNRGNFGGSFGGSAGNGLLAGPRAVGGENPLLRSGLVLAGANQLSGGVGEDGVLTALEAAGLDLWGTKLVVLSACRTGVGDIQNGEGVYGLRRALVLAGAESELMSLWRVDDAATSDLMVEYYKRLGAGEGRMEALRQVQLKMLRSNDRNHPFYWAAFIPLGDWRSLEAK
jgi:CHAT domain-containing protein/tetratricopeptide (TPR) repeat protein